MARERFFGSNARSNWRIFCCATLLIGFTTCSPAESFEFGFRSGKGEKQAPGEQNNTAAKKNAQTSTSADAKNEVDGKLEPKRGRTDQKPANEKPTNKNSIEEHFLSVTPLLTPGTQSQLLVIDSLGAPQANIAVTINDKPFTSDASGHVLFDVPDVNSLDVIIQDLASRRNKKSYRKQGDYLVTEGSLDLASLLSNLKFEWSGNKRIAYLLWAPNLISPDQDFAILGEGFSPQAALDRVVLDGKDLPVVAASKNCILVHVPQSTSVGPVKDLFVEVDRKASNSVELDVCEPFVDCPKDIDPEGEPSEGFIGVRGTNMPAALKLTNNNMEAVSVWMLSSTPMKQTGMFLTPGGDKNSVSLGFHSAQKYAQPSFTLELVPEIAGSSEEQASIGALRRRLAETQVERLNKRLLVVRAQIEECRKKIEKNDTDAAQYELRALSLRKSVLSQMLVSRRALILALKGKTEDYTAAIERSAGGAYANVDSRTGPVNVAPERTQVAVNITTPTSPSVVTDPPQVPGRARLHRLIEPRIKILPPPEPGSEVATTNTQATDAPPVETSKPVETKPAETKPAPKKSEPVKDQKKVQNKASKPQPAVQKNQRSTRSARTSRAGRTSRRARHRR